MREDAYAAAATCWDIDQVAEPILPEIVALFAEACGDRGQAVKLLRTVYMKGFLSGGTRAVQEFGALSDALSGSNVLPKGKL